MVTMSAPISTGQFRFFGDKQRSQNCKYANVKAFHLTPSDNSLMYLCSSKLSQEMNEMCSDLQNQGIIINNII